MQQQDKQLLNMLPEIKDNSSLFSGNNPTSPLSNMPVNSPVPINTNTPQEKDINEVVLPKDVPEDIRGKFGLPPNNAKSIAPPETIGSVNDIKGIPQDILDKFSETPAKSVVDNTAPVDVNKSKGQQMIDDIDKQLTSKINQQYKIADDPAWGGLKQVKVDQLTSDIKALTEQKKKILAEMGPVAKTTDQELLDAKTNPDAFAKLFSDPKLSINKVTRTLADQAEKAMSIKQEDDNKTFSQKGDITMYGLRNYSKDIALAKPQEDLVKPEMDDLYNKISTSPDYINSNFLDRQKTINQGVDNYLKGFDFVSDEAKQKKKQQVALEMGLRYAYTGTDEVGNNKPNENGLKLITSEGRNMLDDYRTDLLNSINDIQLKSPDLAKELTTKTDTEDHGTNQVKDPNVFLKNYYGEVENINKTIQYLDGVLKAPERKKSLTDYLKPAPKVSTSDEPFQDVNTQIAAQNMLGPDTTAMAEALGIKDIISKQENGQELSFSEKKNLEIYSTVANASGLDEQKVWGNLGAKDINMQNFVSNTGFSEPVYQPSNTYKLKVAQQAKYLKSEADWGKKNMFQKFAVGWDQAVTGMVGGTEQLLGELRGIGATPDDYVASQALKDKALANFESRKEVYGKGAMYTLGTFAPLIASTIAAAVAAPITGGGSLSFVPAIISNSMLAGMTADVMGNSLIETDQYAKEHDLPVDPAKRASVAILSGIVMTVAGHVIGGTSKGMSTMYGKIAAKATGSVMAELPDGGAKLMNDYFVKNPNAITDVIAHTGKFLTVEGAKGSSAMALMTVINDALANIQKNPEDRKKLDTIVKEGIESAKGGFLISGLLGSVAIGQNAWYNKIRRNTNGIDIVQTQDGKVHERVSDDPKKPDNILVLDGNDMQQHSVPRNSVIDGFSMTPKESKQYAEAWKNNQDALPEMQRDIKINAIRRKATALIPEIAYADETAGENTPGLGVSGSVGSKVRIYQPTPGGEQFFVRGPNADGSKVELRSIEPRADGSFRIKSFLSNKIDPARITEVPASDYIDMLVKHYSDKIAEPVTKKAREEGTPFTEAPGKPKTPPVPSTKPAPDIKDTELTTTEKKTEKDRIEKERSVELNTVTADEDNVTINQKFDKQVSDVNKNDGRKPRQIIDIQTGVKKTMNMTLPEITAMQDHNDRVIKNNQDLNDLHLLQVDKVSNRVLEPTTEILYNQLKEVNASIKEISTPDLEEQYSNPGGIANLTEQQKNDYNDFAELKVKQDALTNKLTEMHVGTLKFDDLSAEEKTKRLTQEAHQQGGLEGTVEKRAGKDFSVILSDGRKVSAKMMFPAGKVELSEQEQLLLNKVPVIIKPVENLNADQSFSNGVPIYHTMTVFTKDGRKLGVLDIDPSTAKQKARDQRKQEIINEFKTTLEELHHEFFKRIEPGVTGEEQAGLPNAEEYKTMMDKLKNLISLLIERLHIAVSDFMDTLRDAIKSTDIDDNLKDIYLKYVDTHEKEIIRQVLKVQTEREAKEAKGKALPDLNPDELVLPDMETTFTSGPQRMDVVLNTFGNIWRNISKTKDIPREVIETTFFNLAHSDGWNSVTNESTYRDFLENNIGSDAILNTIIDQFKHGDIISFAVARSVFKFYRGSEIMKHVAHTVRNNKSVFKTLNSSENYGSFVARAKATLINYEYRSPYTGEVFHGYDAIQHRLINYQADYKKRFSGWPTISNDVLTAKRIEQHNLDINLLSELTGIPPDIWRGYFTPETRETYAYTDKALTKELNFKTMEALHGSMTYRKGAKQGYERFQSQLGYSLTNSIFAKATFDLLPLDKFKDALNTFFFKGMEDVYSNIFKLASASSRGKQLGISGQDVTNNRFSAFVQKSSVLYQLNNLDKINAPDNELLSWMKSDPTNVEYFMLNGITDTTKNGSNTADDMTVEDMLLSFLSDFTQGTDTYNQWTGQYGDRTQVFMLKVPKHSMADLAEFKKTVGFNIKKTIAYIAKYTTDQYPGVFSSLGSGTVFKKVAPEAIEHFVLNFAKNIADINQIFRGNWSQYSGENGLKKFFKRGATAMSPYMPLDDNIEGGVGKSYKFASVEDTWQGKDKRIDGPVYFRGNPGGFAGKLQVSMGEVFAKTNKYPILTGVKLLHAGVDNRNGNEAISKANWLNIDLWADFFESKGMMDTRYSHIRNFMDKNGLDALGFKSSTKVHESGEDAHIKLWDDNGAVIKDPVIPEGGIVDRLTAQLGYQQDLRHDANGEFGKIPVQILSNSLGMPSGDHMLDDIQSLQNNEIESLNDEFSRGPLEKSKLKLLKANVSKVAQPQLVRLLDQGLSIYDPLMKNYITKLFASSITKKILEPPIIRITSQEVPDVSDMLKDTRHSVSTPGHILLSECMLSAPGKREAIMEHIGKKYNDKDGKERWDAIDFVMNNKNQFRDLFMPDDSLMSWEIIDNEGMIPGEPIPIVRVPTDEWRSFPVARLKYNIPFGNFIAKSREAQEDSGTDGDGDQTLNFLLAKDKNDKMIQVGRNGIATNATLNNDFIMKMTYDFMNPVIHERITTAINTSKFDKLIDKEANEDRSRHDPLSYIKARNENLAGIKMKAITTALMSTVNILQKFGVSLNIPVITKEFTLKGVVNDKWGLIKLAGADLQNMSFDNGNDPKIEHLGYNEFSSPIYILLLIANEKLDSSLFANREGQAKAIEEEVGKIKRLFTSDFGQSFRDYMRADRSALRRPDMKEVWRKLNDDYGKEMPGIVEKFKVLYNIGKEFSDVRTLFSAVTKAPDNYADFVMMKVLFNRVSTGLKYLNTHSFFETRNSEVVPMGIFKMLPDIRNILTTVVFDGLFDTTPVGKKIYRVLSKAYEENEKLLGTNRSISSYELSAISNSINTIATIRAIGIKDTFSQVERKLINGFNDLQDRFPGNKFFDYVQKVETTKQQLRAVPTRYFSTNDRGIQTRVSIEITPEYHHTSIDETEMEKIRDDFDSLPDEVKDLLTTYALYKWGTTTSSQGGSYMKFLGDKYRVDLSQLTQWEYKYWNQEGISQVELFRIAEWAKINSSSQRISGNLNSDGLLDINAIPVKDISSVTPEAATALSQVTTLGGFAEWGKAFDVDNEQFATSIGKLLGLDEKAPVKKFIIEKLAEQEAKIKKMFPTEAIRPSNNELKSQLPYNAVSHILLTDDPELAKFTFDHLANVYPGVVIFSDREKFLDFVAKHNGNLRDVSAEALGHAFRNAAFIDPTTAVQETIMHEHAHIYWDALHYTNPVKKALRDMFKKEFGPYDNTDKLDEDIMREIGAAGQNIADVQFKGSLFDKFMNLLKQFWIEVKKLFRKAGKYDLINDLAWDVYRNEENIKPSSNQGSAEIRSLVNIEQIDDEVKTSFKEDTHTHFINNIAVPSPTALIKSYKTPEFDPSAIAAGKVNQFNIAYKKFTGKDLSDEEKANDRDNLMKHWEDESEGGTAVHLIAHSIFDPNLMNKFDKANLAKIADKFSNSSVVGDTVKIFTTLKNNLIAKYPGIKFYSERQIISKKYMMSGIADLFGEIANHKIILLDYKTTNKNFIDEDGKFYPSYTDALGAFSGAFSNLPQSMMMSHKLQLNMYTNMAEEAVGKDGIHDEVVEMTIIPLIRTADWTTGKITKIELGNPVTHERGPAAERMMSKSWESRRDTSKELKTYRQALTASTYGDKNGKGIKMFDKKTVELALRSVSYVQSLNGGHILPIPADKVNKIPSDPGLTWRNLDNEISGSFTKMMSDLISYGYGSTDIKKIPFEHLFGIITTQNGIQKSDYNNPEMFNKYFPEIETKKKFAAIKNPASKGNKWMHVNKDGNNYYLKEVGYSSDAVDVGTKVGLYISMEKPTGSVKDELNFGVIKAINKNTHTYIIEMEGPDKTSVTYTSRFPDAGFVKVFNEDELPSTKEKMDIKPDSFVPRFIHRLAVETERHAAPIDQKSSMMDSQEYARYSSDLKKVWKELKALGEGDYDEEISNLQNNLGDMYKMTDLFERIVPLHEEAGKNLVVFIQNIIMSHILTNGIIDEYRHYKPEDGRLLVKIMNTYLLLTGRENILYRERGISTFVPPRIIKGSNVPLEYFTSGVTESYRLKTAEAFHLKVLSEAYRNKVNWTENKDGESILSFTDKKGNVIFKLPSEIDPEKYSYEHAFMEQVYKYFYKLDPDYKNEPRTGGSYPKRIVERRTFMQKDELRKITGIGAKWADRFHDMMSVTTYDDYRIPVQTFDNITGTWKDKTQKDKNGKDIPIIKSIGDMKKEFIYSKMDDESMQEFLGSKWMHFWKVPGTKLPFVDKNSEATLLHAYYLADEIKKKGTDANNTFLASAPNRVNIKGSTGEMLFATKKHFDNLITVIDSLLERHYMSPWIAPMENFYNKYASHTVLSTSSSIKLFNSKGADYIKKWGSAMIFGGSGTESIEAFNTKQFNQMADFMNGWVSWLSIAGAPITQKFNFLAGQSMNFMIHPLETRRGLMRFIQQPKKSLAILRMYGLANIVDQYKMDQMERGFKVGPISSEFLEKYGFGLVEFVEKMNQLGVFIGAMHNNEWWAYDSTDGSLVDPANALSPARQSELAQMVNEAQGDYGKLSIAPAWKHPLSKLGLSLHRFIPSAYWMSFLSFRVKNGVVKSGMIPALLLLGKIGIYNVKNNDAQKLAYFEKIKRLSEHEDEIEGMEESIKDVFERIIEMTENGDIIIKDNLLLNSKKNLFTLARMAAVFGVLALWKHLEGGTDDYPELEGKEFTKLLNRYQQDVFYIQSSDNIYQLMSKPIPAMQLLINSMKMIKDAFWYGAYMAGEMTEASRTQAGKDPLFPRAAAKALYSTAPSPLFPSGTPRVVLDMFHVLPFGSATAQVWKMLDKGALSYTYITRDQLVKQGIDRTLEDFIVNNRYKTFSLPGFINNRIWDLFHAPDQSRVTAWDLKISAAAAKPLAQTLKDGLMVLNNTSGLNVTDIVALEQLKVALTAKMNEMKGATLYWSMLYEMHNNPEFSTKQILDASRKLEDARAAAAPENSDRKIYKGFRAIDKVQGIPQTPLRIEENKRISHGTIQQINEHRNQ